MSEISGGSFFREENFKELKDALRPISSGRVVITEIILWQKLWVAYFRCLYLRLGNVSENAFWYAVITSHIEN